MKNGRLFAGHFYCCSLYKYYKPSAGQLIAIPIKTVSAEFTEKRNPARIFSQTLHS
jgi:hypothetical protein